MPDRSAALCSAPVEFLSSIIFGRSVVELVLGKKVSFSRFGPQRPLPDTRVAVKIKNKK